MDCYPELHGVVIALFLTLQPGVWHCQEPELRELKLRHDSSQQRLFVEWNLYEKSHAPDVEIQFQIQVARSKKLNIILNETYTTTLSGSGEPYRWTWDSQLPLECDSHSVRIRSALLGRPWSMWSPWKTHHGHSNGDRTVIYPHEKIVPVGSNVTFCCFPGHNQRVEYMRYGGPIYNSTSLSLETDSYAITVQNVTITRSDGANVICRVAGKNHGTVLIVSKPPDEPKNFSCITQDMETLNCTWSPGHIYNFYRVLAVNYTLHEWLSHKSSPCTRNECIWPVARNQQIYNFTLIAENVMGGRRIHAIVNLTERILPLVPSNLEARHRNSSHITLNWVLKADYTALRLHCQTDSQENLVNTMSRGKKASDVYSVILAGLQPWTKYDLKVRCMSESSLAGWSTWSQELSVWTHEDVPTGALDVWRQVKRGEGRRLVTLYWRPSPAFSANGIISHYNIRWWTLEGALISNNSKVSAQENSSRISIGRQAYAFSVMAENGAGKSPATELRIPRARTNDDEHVAVQKTSSRDGGIYLQWERNPTLLGYVVEWCNEPKRPHCDLQWKKYNSSIDSDVVTSGAFRPGVRYHFHIHGSKEDGEHLLGSRMGYTVELVSSVKPKAEIRKINANSLSLDWSPYPTDESQEGFVTGYIIYLKNTGGVCETGMSDDHIYFNGSDVCRLHKKDPNDMEITINGLQSNTTYEVAVTALTGGGETEVEFTKAHTPPGTGAVILPILLPVLTVALLALALISVGCWKRAWLKEMCYPDIPDPNKSKILSFPAPKGVADRHCRPADIGCATQMVEVVSQQNLECTKTYDSINNTSGDQLDLLYTCIQKNNQSGCGVNLHYVTGSAENANTLHETTHEPSDVPGTKYQEFFNQNYTSSPDCTFDCSTSPGYRPQADSAPRPMDDAPGLDAFNHARCTYLEASPDEVEVCFTNVPDLEREPRSPTSVDSTTFILVA
ncbi:oncostatin-M-specific receptor subunit beta [Pseudophryne corroboree]|uniref:oncostatin-M-specific receptor subunit beta n=1 Tax=Pseudophryne corroboree TaxID=495146 RepID=UPI00308154E5